MSETQRDSWAQRLEDPAAVDWPETWHEFVGEGELCDRCGVNATRAIHSRGFALKNGYEFIDADGRRLRSERTTP